MNAHFNKQKTAEDLCHDGIACYYAEDFVTAFSLFHQAAKLNWMPAYYYLGLCYKHGHGVGKNLNNAIVAFMGAAEYQNPAAMYELGLICEAEPGLKLHYKKAEDWYNDAAHKEYAPALFKMGQLLETGQLVPADLDSAINRYARAAKAGHPEARAAIRRLVTSGNY